MEQQDVSQSRSGKVEVKVVQVTRLLEMVAMVVQVALVLVDLVLQ